MAESCTDLCVPVYLNNQIVFDLLAMLEDGFSQLSSVKTSAIDSNSQKVNLNGSIGGRVLDLIGVSLKGDYGKEKGSQETTETSNEKIHTPASLFSKLRTKLNRDNLINKVKTAEEIDLLQCGELVELPAILKKISLIDTIEGIKRLMEIAVLFANQESTETKGKKHKNEKVSDNQQQIVIKQINGFLEALTQSNSMELTGEPLGIPSARIVLSVDLNYFSSKNPNDVIDGEFYILGKAIRVIKSDSHNTINLLRNTSFRQIDLKIFEGFASAFQGAEEAGLRFPTIVTEIHGPAIQIIPIAIFT